ncbi:hypothetical protein VDG09_03120 [Xanthomonas campestris pv. raphani]|uniref:hypothetical protein n=1 Tax=Xanthomonas campestris TaxID=339 RepID=UPI002B22DD31|nr:hypothetical protein [Xanthomonas campestris]MEA9826655.1 hypothetical protein [Xanthomonas campestris pv. raphani]
MTQFSVPVYEYKSVRPGAPVTPQHPNFVLNDRQLVIATVRAILTTGAGKPARKLTAAIVWPMLRFMLDWRAAPNIQLAPHFSKNVRDFSFTSRIGELAQGASCAYWKWARGYAWICDFGPWAAGLHPTLPTGKMPDFVMFNAHTGDLAIMEAKGTGGHDYKGLMSKALQQCGAALVKNQFHRGYGSVLTLDRKAVATGRAELHLRDPNVDSGVSEWTAYEVFRRSYASWFDLIGQQDMAAWCRQYVRDPAEAAATYALAFVDKAQQDDSIGWIVADSVLPALGFDRSRTQFSVDPAVLRALSDFDIFKKREWLSAIHAGIEKNKISFPDGTIIKVR